MERRFSFEKLEVWRLAMVLAEEVYSITRSFPKEERYGLVDQTRRAAVSISSNLAEGCSRYSYKDQARFTSIAYGSLMELVSQMKLAHRLGWLSDKKLIDFEENAIELSIKITRFRQSQTNRFQEPEVEYSTNKTPQHLNISTSQQGFVHETATLDPGAQIGENTKIWHYSHVMGRAVIGEGCNLGQNVFVANGVVLGDNVKVQNNVSIYEGVICEDDVFLGPSMVFTNVINPRSAVVRKNQYQKTVVGKGATIGANATIVCGNPIGAHAFIGAGAVVTKEIPAFALVVGNPAQQIGWMSEYGHRLHFNEDGQATCPESGEVYILTDGQVQKEGRLAMSNGK